MYHMLNERAVVIVLSSDGMVVSGQRTKQQQWETMMHSELQNPTSQSRLCPAIGYLISDTSVRANSSAIESF